MTARRQRDGSATCARPGGPRACVVADRALHPAPCASHPVPPVAPVLLLICASACAAQFAVEPGDGFTVRLDGLRIATAGTPKAFAQARLTPEKNGYTAVAAAGRLELAAVEGQLEYTYDYQLGPRVEPWSVLFVPLGKDDSAEVVHGSFEKQPKKRTLLGSDLTHDGEAGIPLVRYLVVRREGRTFSLDTQPAGCMDDQTDATSPMRTLACWPVKGGLEIRATLRGSRASYPATMRAKFIFYADGRGFRQVHPFVIMNYRYAFEKVLKLDFTRAAMPKKAHMPRSVGTQAYAQSAGYGWASDPAALELRHTSLAAPLYGEFIASRAPGRFRIDLPPGHYYLTLNLGSADGPTGPMGVTVNGERRLTEFTLPPGRFKAEVMWVTSKQDHVDVRFDGAAWQINALTVSSLGTLNEDFALTRPWWRFAR